MGRSLLGGIRRMGRDLIGGEICGWFHICRWNNSFYGLVLMSVGGSDGAWPLTLVGDLQVMWC